MPLGWGARLMPVNGPTTVRRLTRHLGPARASRAFRKPGNGSYHRHTVGRTPPVLSPAVKLMKAMVYGGPGHREWAEVQDPSIEQPTDAIVKMVTATICGTDLHILKGDVPAVHPGRILGHEGVGRVVETGPAVRGVSGT